MIYHTYCHINGSFELKFRPSEGLTFFAADRDGFPNNQNKACDGKDFSGETGGVRSVEWEYIYKST